MSGHRAAELLLFSAAYIAAAGERSALCRPFFLARNDTHDGVDRKVHRTQVPRKLSTKFKEETNNGKPGNDPHPAEGL